MKSIEAMPAGGGVLRPLLCVIFLLVPVIINPAAASPQTLSGVAIDLELDSTKQWVNVMKTTMPKMPAFPTLQPKPGTVRGYVKDTKGMPLKNARLGVRSTLVGGSYSGAQGKTDEKGYYEIQVPMGAAHFYNAGYTIDYGEGRAALGLHPADGELDSFASNVGGVENFVLLPYGITDRDRVQEKPYYSGNYYGGCISLSWDIADENPFWARQTDFPANSEIVIALTPQGALPNGEPGRSILIRKQIGETSTMLGIVNIPITTYKLSAKLSDGTALRLKEVGPNGGSAFGIEPKEAMGTVDLQLRPGSAQAERAGAALGNWDSIAIKLTR